MDLFLSGMILCVAGILGLADKRKGALC